MKNSRTVLSGMTALLGMSMAAIAETGTETIQYSSFDQRSVQRNPFLPIGWVKDVKVVHRSEPVTISPEAFKVTSIVVDSSGGLAIINGKACAPGDVIVTTVGAKREPVRVKEVRDGEVVLFHNGKPIVSSLLAR